MCANARSVRNGSGIKLPSVTNALCHRHGRLDFGAASQGRSITPMLTGSDNEENKMKRFEKVANPLLWFMALLLVAFVAACSNGSNDPILGGGGAVVQATLADTTRPRVSLTIPADLATAVPANAAISATFTEAMDPATIIAANFTVVDITTPGAVPSVTVTYDAVSRTVSFTHAGLTAGHSYTATVTTAATDLAGNALAGISTTPLVANDHVWTFTAAAANITPPIVNLESPVDLATNVATNTNVNARFSKDMDPATLCTTTSLTAACPVATFTVVNTTLGGTDVEGTVVYLADQKIASFRPTATTLPDSTQFTATVTAGATDSAGIALDPLGAGTAPNPWTFTTGMGLAPGAITLGSTGTFGIMATSAITSIGNSIINGDVSLDPGTSMTGFPPAIVNGSIHINDSVSAQARQDLLQAYNEAKALPPGTIISAGADLGALYISGIPPGTYTSGSTMLVSTPLTLDAGGDANAVWVFQIGSSLTTSASVTLANGAQSKNVFWVPTSDATIGVGTIFEGTIISGRDVTAVTGSTINGRILAGAITAGTIALQAAVVNVPAP